VGENRSKVEPFIAASWRHGGDEASTVCPSVDFEGSGVQRRRSGNERFPRPLAVATAATVPQNLQFLTSRAPPYHGRPLTLGNRSLAAAHLSLLYRSIYQP
jgi:hypothetical protein